MWFGLLIVSCVPLALPKNEHGSYTVKKRVFRLTVPVWHSRGVMEGVNSHPYECDSSTLGVFPNTLRVFCYTSLVLFTHLKGVVLHQL